MCTATYPEWHAYVKYLYGRPLHFPIDLNTFTWFYCASCRAHLDAVTTQLREPSLPPCDAYVRA